MIRNHPKFLCKGSYKACNQRLTETDSANFVISPACVDTNFSKSSRAIARINFKSSSGSPENNTGVLLVVFIYNIFVIQLFYIDQSGKQALTHPVPMEIKQVFED